MKLTTYFRSTAAYRVRIALGLKQIDHELVAINLFTGEHKSDEFIRDNPDGLIPVLDTGTEKLTQSLAILEYLEERYPQPPMLPTDPAARAFIRALSQTIACDIHPLNNLRVLQFLVGDMGLSEAQKLEWYHHWIKTGFSGLETRLSNSAGQFCVGDTLSMADVCLIPQVFNALRFECPMEDYPTIRRINEHCLSLEVFDKARPERQPDFEV